MQKIATSPQLQIVKKKNKQTNKQKRLNMMGNIVP
jgi:hypothetical protein